MMNNSKSKHSNDPTKSKPRGKQNKTKKSSKKKNADSDNNKEQDDAVSSSAGHYVNTLEQPLTRRPLSSTSNEDTVETVYADSNHVPLVIPKWEKPDTQRKSFHLARDPRMTSNPIMERDDDMDEDISNEAFPTDLTNNELVQNADVLESIIDINVENVKNEIDDLEFCRENDDWKTRFWSEANSTTEEPTAVPVVRIKSEPMDENAFNPSSEPIEDDRCSIDSGSIVGLPSPGRASPTPSLKNGEVNQTAGGISDDNETPRISPEQRLISSERKDDADVTPASGIQSGMTVQHLPPQQPAQPVAAQIPVIAQQNLIPVQASSSRNSGAPVPTLIQPSTSVLTQSNSMHPVVLLPPSAPLQQQSQPTPVVPIHGPPPLVPNRGLIPQHPHTPIKYLIKDWGIPSDTPAAPPATTTPRSGAATSSANDDWGSEADAWASGTSSKPTTPRAAPAASSSGGGGDDWSSAADNWASGSSSKTTTPSASKSDDPWSIVVNSGGWSYCSRGRGGGTMSYYNSQSSFGPNGESSDNRSRNTTAPVINDDWRRSATTSSSHWTTGSRKFNDDAWGAPASTQGGSRADLNGRRIKLVEDKDSGRRGSRRRSRSSSRSRSRSRSRRRSRRRSRSRSRSSRRSRRRLRSRSRCRSKSRSRSKRSGSKSRRRSKSRGHSKSKSKSRLRSPRKSRFKSRSRDKSMDRSKSKSHSRSLRKSRSKSRSRDKSVDRDRSVSRDKSVVRPDSVRKCYRCGVVGHESKYCWNNDRIEYRGAATESLDAPVDVSGLGSTANGSKTSTSRSAAPASSEPNDWNAATNNWGSVTSNRTAAKTTPITRPASSSGASNDDWGASADAWASGGSSAPRGRTTPSASPAGTSTDDWGAPSKTPTSGNGAAADDWNSGWISTSNPCIHKSTSAPKPGGGDYWGAKADAWASSKGRTTPSTNKGDDWGGSTSSSSPWATGANAAPVGRTYSRGGSRSGAPAVNQPAPVDDWGIPSDTPAAPPATTTPRSGAATSSANDDWGSEADAWASGTSSKPTTPRAAPAASSSGGGGDDWSSAADTWASGSSSKTTTPSASKSDDPWSVVVNSEGSSYSSRGGGGGSYGSRGGAGGRGGGGRPCFNCNEEGHMSRECPKPSTRGGGRGGGRGGSAATCYNCNEDGHMSRECPKPSTRGRGGGRGGGSGGGRNTCFKCNEEGHMSRDCSNGGSSGGGSRSRSGTAPADDDWGTSSATSSSIPWATGANAAPRGRATPSAGKSNDDVWGAPAPPRGGSRSTPSASKSNDDDWGASTTAPGTTPRSGDGRRSSRPGGRSPRQMEMDDATPLNDE